jgi:hypothetical protein
MTAERAAELFAAWPPTRPRVNRPPHCAAGPHVIAGVAKELGLLRIDQSADADVLLQQPMSEGALVRPHPELINGIECAGLVPGRFGHALPTRLEPGCCSPSGRCPGYPAALADLLGVRSAEPL